MGKSRDKISLRIKCMKMVFIFFGCLRKLEFFLFEVGFKWNLVSYKVEMDGLKY